MRDGLTTRVLGDTRLARVIQVDDSGDVQLLQVESHDGEGVPDVPHLQPYGLTACPPKEARTLAKLIGGAWDNVVALFTTHGPHRPRNLKAGDVTLYSGHGVRVDLRAGGVVIVVPDGATIQLGGATSRALLAELAVELLKGHQHPVMDDVAGPSAELMDLESTLSDTVLLR